MIVHTDKHRVPFQIDGDDYEAVSHYAWHIDTDGYPRTGIGSGRGRQRSIRLHIFLLGRAGNEVEWDHENRDKLDNRRSNLRPMTHAGNQRNKVAPGERGVVRRRKRWHAQINVEGRRRHLGTFDTEQEARRARHDAELAFWGGTGATIRAAMNPNP